MTTRLALQHLLLALLLVNIEHSFAQTLEEPWQSCPSEIDNCACKDYPNSRRRFECGSTFTVNDYITKLKQLGLPGNIRVEMKFSNVRKTPNYLASNTFEGLNITRLEFSECNITKWADEIQGPAFVGLEDSLEYLNIFKTIKRRSPPNTDDVIPAEFSLRHFRKVKEIDMQRNTLWNVCNQWLGDGLEESLERLTLADNEIWSVCDDAFANLKKLRYINLSNNKLFEVSRNMFPYPALYLEEIDLNTNKIRDPLPRNLFENMPALKKISFNGNHDLFRIQATVWRPIWTQLFWLDFQVQTLSCMDTSVGWMFTLKRPEILYGKCSYPENRRGMLLSRLIDENQRNSTREF